MSKKKKEKTVYTGVVPTRRILLSILVAVGITALLTWD